MNTRRISGFLAATAAIATLGLTGCSGGGSDSAVCEVLTSDTRVAATVFSAAIPGMSDVTLLNAQNDLLEQIETPPKGLETEWEQWLEYRDFAAKNFTSDPGAVVQKYTEVSDASTALTEFYTGSCL